jgi:DNA polymerase III subunit gamma/tau
LLDHYRNLLVLSLGGDEPDVTEADLELLQRQVQRTDSDAVLRIIDALAGAEGRLRYALSKRIYFEIAIIRAIKARQMVSLDVVLQKLNELKAGTPSVAAASPPRPARDSRGEDAAPPTATSAEQAWAQALEQLGKATPLAKSYFVGTRVIGLKAGTLTVAFDSEFPERRDLADTARNRELLQAKLKEFLRSDVTLKFELTDVAGPRLPATPAGKGADDFKDDPLIKKALEIFKGQIVNVRK